ncbi:MAG TPA: protein translocase subunit SecF, partial [Gammaproteobacteria bacterium]|nr:protein translocase subunit SecF [Gammaproteobacteria bacterium]
MRTLQIDFMGKRKIALIVSVSLLLVALLSLATRGLNQGLDFTGGSLLEVGFSQEVDPEDVRGYLESTGFNNGTVQYFGTNRDLLIRMP